MNQNNCYINLLHLIEQNKDKDYSVINDIVSNWIESNPDLVKADQDSIDNVKNILMSLYVNYQLDYNKVLENLRKLLQQGQFDINAFIASRLQFYFNQDAVRQIYSNLDIDTEFRVISDLTKQVVKMSITQYSESVLAPILRTPLTPQQQDKIYESWDNGELSSDVLYKLIKDNVYDKTKLAYLAKLVTKTIYLIDKDAIDAFKRSLLNSRAEIDAVNNAITTATQISAGIIKSFDQLRQSLGIDSLIQRKHDLQAELADLNDQLKADEITLDEFNKKSDVINQKLEVIGNSLFNATTVLNKAKILKTLLNKFTDSDINNISSLINIANMLQPETAYLITDLVKLINSCIIDDNVVLVNNTDPTNPAIEIIKYIKSIKLSDTSADITQTLQDDILKYLKTPLSAVSISKLKRNLDEYLKINRKSFYIKNGQLNSKIRNDLGIDESSEQAAKVSKLASDTLFNVGTISIDDLNKFISNLSNILNTDLTTDQRKTLVDGISKIYGISVNKPKLNSNPKIEQTNIFNINVLKNIVIYQNTKSEDLVPDTLKNKNSLLLALILHLQQGINQPFSLDSIMAKFNLSSNLKNLGITAVDLNSIMINSGIPRDKYITAKIVAEKTGTSDLFNVAKNISQMSENNVNVSDFLISNALHKQNVDIDEDKLSDLNNTTKSELNSISQGTPSKLMLNKDYFKLISDSAQWKMLVNKMPTYDIPDEVLNSPKKKYLFKVKDPDAPIILKSGVIATYINNTLVRTIVQKGDTASQVVDALNVAYSEASNTTEAPVVATNRAIIVLGEPTDINPQLTSYSDGVLDTNVVQTQSSIVEFDKKKNNPNLIYPGKIKLNRYKISIPQTDNFVGDSGEAEIRYSYNGSEYPYFYYSGSTVSDFTSDLVSQFGDAITKKTPKFYVITTPNELTITKSGFKEGVADLQPLPPVNNTPLTIPTTFSSDDTINPNKKVSENTTVTATIDDVDVPINIPKGITYAEALDLINSILLKLGINVTANLNPDNTVTVASSDQNDNVKFSSDHDTIIPKLTPDPISNEDILATDPMKEFQAQPPVSDDKSVASFAQYTGTSLEDSGNFQTPDSTFPHLPKPADPELNNTINDILGDTTLTPEEQASAINDALDQNDGIPKNTDNIPQEVPKSKDKEPDTPNGPTPSPVPPPKDAPPKHKPPKDHKPKSPKQKLYDARKKWNNYVRELQNSKTVKNLNKAFNYLANPPQVTDKDVAETNITVPSERDTLNIANAQLQAMGVFNGPFPPKGDFDTTDYLAPGYVPPTKLDRFMNRMNDVYNFSRPGSVDKDALRNKINDALPSWISYGADGNFTIKAGYTLDLTKNPAYQRLNKFMNMNLNKIAQAYIDEQLLFFNQLLQAMLLDFEAQFTAGLKPFFDLFKSINSILDTALKGLKKPNLSLCGWGFSLPGLNFDLFFLLKYFPFHLPFLDLDALLASIIKAIIQAFRNMINMAISALKYVWVMLKLLVKTAVDLLHKAYMAIVKALGMITCDIIATIANVLTIVIAAIRIVSAITKFINSVRAPKIKLDPAKIAAKVRQAKNRAKNRV